MAVATLHYKIRQTETLNFEIFELNGKSEAAIQRTNNIMTKRKRIKSKTMIDKKLHEKLKIEQHEPTYSL
jgi:hypothetical protein